MQVGDRGWSFTSLVDAAYFPSGRFDFSTLSTRYVAEGNGRNVPLSKFTLVAMYQSPSRNGVLDVS